MIRSKRNYIPVQRFNPDFDDDPVKLISLPPSEKTSEFWKRYDRQADIHDTKMTDDLGENLDVLLIFAALFSAINTAFISLTMPGLSSDPLTETNTLLRLLVTRADNNTLVPAGISPPFAPSSNSVVVNCLLYASLSCSLLASVGAMMAKEWLQSFDRTGQTGPLEEQGRYRQRKFNGVQQWHLESIIRSLPNILMLSVILFFAGICLFLFPVNRAVAGVVIAFSGIGAVFCGIAIVAGAISPLCPYQSAASRAIKRMGLLLSSRWWRDLVQAVVGIVVHRLPKLVRKIFDAIHHYPSIASGIVGWAPIGLVPIGLVPTPPSENEISEKVAITEAARWLIQTTSNHGDQIAAAQFICTLGNPACVMALDDPKIWRQFLSLTQEVFDVWHSQPTETVQQTLELFGLTLCHVLYSSKDTFKIYDLTDSRLYQSGGFGGTFLRALEFAWTRHSCHKSEDRETILHIAFLLAITSRGQAIPQYQWTGLSRFFLTGNTSLSVDALLGLWAKMFCSLDSSFNRPHAFFELVDQRDKTTVLARDLSNALICGTRVLSSVGGNQQSESHALRGYTACLQKAAQTPTRIRRDELTNVIDSVADFIVSYVDPLASSKSRETSSELVRVSIEAVLALHSFIDHNARRDQIGICWDAGTDQLGNEYVINAAVHIMLGDFGSLTSSTLLPRMLPQMLGRATEPVEYRVMKRVAERAVRRVAESAAGWAAERAAEQAWPTLLTDGRADELTVEVTEELTGELTGELAWELAWELDTPGEMVEELTAHLDVALESQLGRRLESELESRLESRDLCRGLTWRLAGRLAYGLVQGLARGLEARLESLLEAGAGAEAGARALRIAKDLAQRLRVESSVLRILLYVWRRTPGQREHLERREMFISSCRLWAPLETRVDFTINGIEWGVSGERLTFDEGDRQNLLTDDDMNEIVEFVEDIQKDREKSEFIARGADVGINRLYVHFNRRVDWNYDLYDLREQHTWCPRSTGKGMGMIL